MAIPKRAHRGGGNLLEFSVRPSASRAPSSWILAAICFATTLPCGWRWPSGAGSCSSRPGNFPTALNEYQRALDANRASSLANYRIGEVFFMQDNYQSAANAFREALTETSSEWVEVWSHINLGKIFDTNRPA